MYHPMKNMNNQEKNTYVRQHILSALLELMETQEFASISIRRWWMLPGSGGHPFTAISQAKRTYYSRNLCA